MNAIQFHNFSDEDFTWKFDGIAYNFPAGSTMFLEDFKAEHFAQHLVDRELNKRGIMTNNQVERKRLGAMCFPSVETVTPVEALQKNAEKNVKKVKKEEEEFPGLKKEAVVKDVVEKVHKVKPVKDEPFNKKEAILKE